MHVLAIDPSVNHLGWVVMTPNKILAKGTIDAPTEFKQVNLVQRIDWIIKELNAEVYECWFDTIAIEEPEPWGAYKSMASSRSGSLQILTLVVGALVGWAMTRAVVEDVKLIKVSQHKGQLPKRITQERMEQKYHCKFKTDHESDACSIGDYILTDESN